MTDAKLITNTFAIGALSMYLFPASSPTKDKGILAAGDHVVIQYHTT